jgi:hypothetical protein
MTNMAANKVRAVFSRWSMDFLFMDCVTGGWKGDDMMHSMIAAFPWDRLLSLPGQKNKPVL